MSMPDMELRKLRKVYDDGTTAVEGIDLIAEPGEFISFVGPSGCGKTTTLRMMSGLESITSGEFRIRGRDFTHVPAERRPTATIFQNYAIFPHMTVRQNIAFGLDIRRMPAAESARRVDAIMEKFSLGDVADATEEFLSGGQKQRVALARGLVTEPDILLLDEPLGALDANLRKSIQEELKLLQRELGKTFIFVTHAQSEALSMGDRVIVMNAGKVEQIAPPLQVYTRPASAFVARFIGRNKLVPGTLERVDAGHATVSTRFGKLSGVPVFSGHDAPARANAIIVAPSEYIRIVPSRATAIPEFTEAVPATVRQMDAVGETVFVLVDLGGNATRLETHSQHLAGTGIEPGSEVELRWSPERATVVLDAA